MCIQFEGMVATLRFRLTPWAGGMEETVLTLDHAGTGQRKTWGPQRVKRTKEIRVELGAQPAGNPTWTVRLQGHQEGHTLQWEGDVELLVVRPREARLAADNLKVEINNHITMGDVVDAHVNQRALEGLEGMAASENPFDELRKVVCGEGRSWQRVELYESTASPEVAKRERISLRWDGGRLTIFGGREVRFGRNRPSPGGTDFTLRPGAGESQEAYWRISGRHGTFVRGGGGARLYDGARDASGRILVSRNGTWWNDERVGREGVFLPVGATGFVSFGGTVAEGAVSLKADCGEGGLLLRRGNGKREAFLMLWGSFEGRILDVGAGEMEILRKDGAFAWRCAGRSGWLVPGERADLPWGPTEVEAGP